MNEVEMKVKIGPINISVEPSKYALSDMLTITIDGGGMFMNNFLNTDSSQKFKVAIQEIGRLQDIEIELDELRAYKTAVLDAMFNGADEDVWPSGLTVPEAITRMIVRLADDAKRCRNIQLECIELAGQVEHLSEMRDRWKHDAKGLLAENKEMREQLLDLGVGEEVLTEREIRLYREGITLCEENDRLKAWVREHGHASFCGSRVSVDERPMPRECDCGFDKVLALEFQYEPSKTKRLKQAVTNYRSVLELIRETTDQRDIAETANDALQGVFTHLVNEKDDE